MMQTNKENCIVLMKLWENSFVPKAVLQKPLLRMHSAHTGYKKIKPEFCTIMQLWENALVQKCIS